MAARQQLGEIFIVMAAGPVALQLTQRAQLAAQQARKPAGQIQGFLIGVQHGANQLFKRQAATVWRHRHLLERLPLAIKKQQAARR